MSPPVTSAAGPFPRVRVITINFDGGDMTWRCLESLLALDWPEDRLEVVMVDNASVDGLARRVQRHLPRVRVIDSLSNEGFARGNNLAMADLDGVDHVALLNNDATVEPTWLRTLVDALEAEPSLGAVCPKILFADPAVGVHVSAPLGPAPRPDTRLLGVRITGVLLDDRPAWRELSFDEGWHGDEGAARWSRAEAEVRVWLPDGTEPPRRMALRLDAPERKKVTLQSGAATVVEEVGPEPRWVEVDVDPVPFDVVNNAGSNLYRDGSAGDRGFLERDEGQYDEPAEVFAWCGGGVLLRGDYLRDVGVFDPRWFLYYEDTELSWRGRLLGWRYRYVPDAVVRHQHAASSGEGSEFFRYWVDRNRLLTLAKLAPLPWFARVLAGYTAATASIVRGEVLRPLARLRRPRPQLSRQRLRSLRAALAAAPAVRRDGRRVRRRRVVGDRAVLEWALPR